jgi:predicted Zn-dependent peptidase
MNRILYSFFILAFLASCSKTTTDGATMKKVEEIKQNVESISTENAWRSAVPQPGPARKINMGAYNTMTMPNGLEVIVVENHKLPRVSYQMSLKNKPILEKDAVGFVSMAGDLMRTGTKTKSKAEIDAEIDFLGASLNTSGSGMFASSLTKHQDKLLAIVSDVLNNPSFPQEEFDKLKKQTISGIQSSKTDPNSMASNVASVLNYGKNHPYGEVTTEETVGNITVEKCRSYYNTFFKPNNARLTIVGDITPEEAKANVEKYFGDWKKGTIPAITYDKPAEVTGANVAFVNKDAAVQSVINVTYPVDIQPGSADDIPSSIMNSILGGGIFSGRLMQNLREDKAYTYGARSRLSSDELIGNFNAFASVRNEVTDSSVTEFIYEMKRLATENVSQDDLDLIKSSMSGGFARSLESPQTIARFARNIVKYNLPADYYETYLEKIEAVTIADVKRMAEKYIRPENANILVVGNKDEVAEKLVAFDSDGKLDCYDAYGNILDMTNTAMPTDVSATDVISDYIDAIGGKAKVNALKSMEQHLSMEVMGQAATVDLFQKAPDKFALKISASGMVMQEQKYDGTKGFSGGMGQSQVITEGPELEKLKEEAVMVKQTKYLTSDYKLELKGIEDIEGEKCYKLNVVNPVGDKATEYYSVSKNHLLRSVSSQEGPQGSVTITQDYGDYKEVDGMMFPHKMTTSGMMPVPLVMNVTSIKVNQAIDDSVFTISQ